MINPRPNPDDLLKKILKANRDATRGRLKIFFGMCPGVGKTYAMLKAGLAALEQGERPLIGVVETHKRRETEELVQSLESLPRKVFAYKGTAVEEFDIDEALRRKPKLILVDELAHTNAVGSRHAKRYQDVDELLRAGIDVYTTINVQHIESRVDLVQQISGVAVREWVPDQFVGEADEIELIDISPEQLLRRLEDGKVYQGEGAVRAAQNFFKLETLTALRELSLRFTAEVVDEGLRNQMVLKGISGPWNTGERLMVAVSHSPFSGRLIRATRRMAYNLEAPWIALYVDLGIKLNEASELTLKKNLDSAQELGAEVIMRKDASLISAMTSVAQEKNVTQIIMGRPDRRLVKDFLSGGNILDQLVQETSEIDIHIIRQKQKARTIGFGFQFPEMSSERGGYFKTVTYIALVTAIGLLILPYLGYRAMGFVFLIASLPIALLAGFGPIFLAACLSALIWDFCFIPPQFTFAINDSQDVMMILAYFAVAIVSGVLAKRLRAQEAELKQRELKANTLYEFEKFLAASLTPHEIADSTVKAVFRIFKFDCFLLRAKENESLEMIGNSIALAASDAKTLAVAEWTFRNLQKAGRGTETLSSSLCVCYPLVVRSKAVGVLVAFPQKVLTLEQQNLLETIAANVASALERDRLQASSQRAQLLEESEKMHQTLLNSVSHDLRTPLTAILGTAERLSTEEKVIREQNLVDLVHTLSTSAGRLRRTIDNVLDMSRVSSGLLQIKKDYLELGDFVENWLARFKVYFPLHKLQYSRSDKQFIIRGDEKLLETALTNLVANASQHSPEQSCIEIQLSQVATTAILSVVDEGAGFQISDIPRAFDRFFRGQGHSSGLGLGLSIVKAIADAHDGSVAAANRETARGAKVSMSLPLEPEMPEASL